MAKLLHFLKTNHEQIFLYLIYFVIFLFLLFPASDKDMGWHFRYGEYLFKHGTILFPNTFSWSLPNFVWVNHSWLYDPLLYIIFKATGYIGLSIAGSLVYLISFIIIVREFKLKYWHIGILGFFFVKLTESGILEGLRSQDIIMPLLAFLLVILFRARQKPKLLYWLPPIFLLWANLHGSFPLGLVISGVFLTCYYLASGKNFRIYLTTFLTSIAATFINPFGYRVYLEALSRLDNPFIKNVIEWEPIYQSCTYCHLYTFAVYALILLFFFIHRKKFLDLPFLIIFLGFLYPSIDTRRNLPLFALVTLSFLALSFQDLHLDLAKSKAIIYLSTLCLIVGLEYNLFNRLPNFNFYRYTEQNYCNYSGNCSSAMAKYLIANPLTGKGFTFYDWGGYYIGKNVPEKMFIDGRMHVWQDAAGYQPFADYFSIYYQQGYQKFISFNFDWVLVPLSSDIGQKIYNTDDLGRWRIGFRDNDSILYLKGR